MVKAAEKQIVQTTKEVPSYEEKMEVKMEVPPVNNAPHAKLESID